MRALQSNSVPAVRAVLQEDPEQLEVFVHHNFDPPLCYAARADCGASIMSLLREYGADVNATDVKGRTPLALTCARQVPSPSGGEAMSWLMGPKAFLDSAEWEAARLGYMQKRELAQLQAAARLLAMGADPALSDLGGLLPSDHAYSSKKLQLACLVEHYDTVQTWFAFVRGMRNYEGLHPELVCKLCSYVFPANVMLRLEPMVTQMQ